jgi:rhamnogalacturonyl hydrolase YesR
MLMQKQTDTLKQSALESALKGLDFFVRNQIQEKETADHGRFPYVYDCDENQIITMTTNWTTGVVTSALLAGYKYTGEEKYLDAAKKACSYIKALQDFNPLTPRVNGVFHESTPQTEMAHPRDALTAAWALLDCSLLTGDKEGIERAKLYGEWFLKVALEKGYPLWTVRFDDEEWEPSWCGSFHSGSAFFMYRLYQETEDDRYLKAMRQILDFYNAHLIDKDGYITVIRDRNTLEVLDGKADQRFTNPGWEMMHRFNDDFGALANLAAWKITGESSYRNSAESFMRLMCKKQRTDGSFGPEEWGVPSAGGAVVLEMLAAKQLGIDLPEYAPAVEKAVEYLLKIQKDASGDKADGAFFGMTDQYEVSTVCANARTAAYAIMALLRYAGAVDNIYYFD